MKVLVVVHGYPPAAVGGTELYAEAHAMTLARAHGDEVTVLTRECDPSRSECAVRSEHRHGLRLVFVNNTYRQTRSFEDTYASQAIGRAAEAIIDQVGPDLAHIHHLTHLSTTIVDSLARRNIPVVMTLHDYWMICHRGQLLDTNYRICEGPEMHGCGSCVGLAGSVGRLAFAGASTIRTLDRALPSALTKPIRFAAQRMSWLTARDGAASEQSRRRTMHMRRICRRVDHFFAPSQFMRDQFIQFGVSAERITCSPYGIDHATFGTLERPARQPGPLRLGFFGSLMVSKAPHLLIEAAAHLPPGSVSVDLFGTFTPYHGDDSYRAVLQPVADRSGIRFRGPIHHARVAAALRSLDAVVVPSIWPENSPFVIHEALLARVPVVASRIGGIPEIVEHGRNGLLFEPGNAKDLRRQLERLLREDGLRDALRDGTPRIRTIEDDAGCMRERYERRPRSGRPARLAAIVLNFQTPEETLLAVKALLQSDREIDDVIVVNNGRGDSLSALRAALEPVASAFTLLHTGENLGFSGGMNAGIRAALARGADRVLLVNSDVIVPPDCITHLEAAIDDASDVGIVGPVMVARTDPGTIASLGIAYSHATGRMRHQHFGAALSETMPPAAQRVDAVSGCVMLIRREVLTAIGNLDEAYFFSFEDVDFCIRAQRAGFISAIVGAARVHHEGHRTIGHTTPARLYFAARNHLLLARRVNGSSMPFGFWAAPIVAYNVAHAFRTSGGSLPARLAAVARGTWDYALGRFGAGAESARLTR